MRKKIDKQINSFDDIAPLALIQPFTQTLSQEESLHWLRKFGELTSRDVIPSMWAEQMLYLIAGFDICLKRKFKESILNQYRQLLEIRMDSIDFYFERAGEC